MTTATPPRFERLDLGVVRPHPRNVRRAIGDITELTDSIRAQGILQPLVVAPAATPGTYVLIVGHRRHAAATRAQLPSVPCMVRDDLADDVDQIEAMLAENLQRADLDAVEEGDAYQALLELDVTVKEIRAKTGRSTRTIRDRLKLAAAPESVRDKVIARQVTIDDALALESFADDETAYNKLAPALGTKNWAWALRDAKTSRDAARTIADLRAALQAEGIAELVDTTADDMVEAAAAAGRDLQWTGPRTARPDDADTADLGFRFVDYGVPADRVRWYCLTPTVDVTVPPAPGAIPPAPSDPAERERARADREKLTADLATAAAVRREHLAATVVGADNAPDLARTCLVRMVLDEDIDLADVAADLLGVTPPVWAGDEDADDLAEKVLARVTDKLNACTVNTLAVLLRVLRATWADNQLRQPTGWTSFNFSRRQLDAWRTELAEDFGYEWSDVEAELIDTLTTTDQED